MEISEKQESDGTAVPPVGKHRTTLPGKAFSFPNINHTLIVTPGVTPVTDVIEDPLAPQPDVNLATQDDRAPVKIKKEDDFHNTQKSPLKPTNSDCDGKDWIPLMSLPPLQTPLMSTPT